MTREDSHWDCGDFQGETKVVETETLKTIRKCVRPISAQSNFESRRLWQNVTDNLKKGDIDTATQHKRFVSVEDHFLELFIDDVPVNSVAWCNYSSSGVILYVFIIILLIILLILLIYEWMSCVHLIYPPVLCWQLEERQRQAEKHRQTVGSPFPTKVCLHLPSI